jgi:hypothetical protein
MKDLPHIDIPPRSSAWDMRDETDILSGAIRLMLAQRGFQAESQGLAARQALGMIVSEGRRFRATPEGAQWAAMLDAAPLAQNGWMLWNMLGLDRLVGTVEDPGGSPGDMLDQFLRQLGESQMHDLIALLSRLTIEADRHAA